MFSAIHAPGNLSILLDCARQFSPLIEITSEDMVTFDIRGLTRIYGSAEKIAKEIDRLIGLPANIAIASNPDAAIHAARGIPGITVIPPGLETATLAPLSLNLLSCPPEMGELFELWGIRNFRQFAELPPLGVVARLGEESIYWQRLAQGRAQRQLRLMDEKVSFSRDQQLEDAIPSLEPLFFLIARFLGELCLELSVQSLATNEVRLRLSLESKFEHLVTLRLPIPMTDQKALLKLLQLDLSEYPPPAAVNRIRLEMEPAKPRTTQEGLFSAEYPAPEKIDLTIARIRHFVGAENIGSPRILDTHKPDSFVIEPFAPAPQQPEIPAAKSSIRSSFRRFRPPQTAYVVIEQQPVHIASPVAKGEIRIAKGPWLTSGHWWKNDMWNREEWDIALRGGALYRIFRDLITQSWFVEGNYD